MKFIAIVFVITLCLLASAVSGADVSLSYRSSLLWTGIVSMIPQDTLMYCAAVSGVMVYNMADPTTPTFVSKLYLEDGSPTGFQLRGNLLYVLENYHHLYVVDISDPVHPFVAGTYYMADWGRGLDVADTLAYIGYFSESSTDSGGLLVLNVATPSAITAIGRLTEPDSNLVVGAVKVIGNYVYCMMGCWFSVVDVSDPTQPVHIAAIRQDDPYAAWYMAKDIVACPGDTLLLLANNSAISPILYSQLRIVNVADPYHPVEVGAVNFSGALVQVRLQDSVAYVSNGMRGVALVNIADPAHPDTLGRYGMEGGNQRFNFAGGLGVMDSVLFVSDYGPQSMDVEGVSEAKPQPPPLSASPSSTIPDVDFHSVSVADPVHPVRIGGFRQPASVTGAVPGGRYVYALYNGNEVMDDTSADLRIIDLLNPDTPVVRGTYYTPYSATDGLLVDTLLYLATGQLEVLNVSDPDHPVLIGGVLANEKCIFIVKRDNYIYAACDRSGMRIYDVADPVHPIRIATLGTRYSAAGIAVSGNYAYIGDVYAGLAVADISDPLHPVLLSYYDNSVVVGETYLVHPGLLCCAVWDGFVLYDIQTNPEAPQRIATCPYYWIQGIAVRDPFVFVANGWYGVDVVDISDPYAPRVSTTTPIPNWADFVTVDDRFMYVSNECSFIIYDWTDITDAPGDQPNDLPMQFSLDQNYPNPFNPSTTIAYDLPHRGRVRLTIYNVLGQEVTTLVDREQSAGHHTVPWRGDGFGSGMYFYRLDLDGVTESRKMLLVK